MTGGAAAAVAIGTAQQPVATAPPARAAPTAAPAASETAAALAALDSLKTQGLITDEEYQAKRSEILGRI